MPVPLKPAFRFSNDLLFFVGIVVLALACGVNWYSSRRHGADYLSLYLLARGMTTRQNVYSPAVFEPMFRNEFHYPGGVNIFYPPSTGVVLLPLGMLPYTLSSTLWFLLMLVSVTWVTKELLRLVAPGMNKHSWMLISGLILLSACVRWGMYALQGAPLLYSCLGLFVLALHHSNRRVLFVITCFVVCFKATFALPLFGLLLLHRHYRMCAGVVGVWILLNVMGFWLLGAGAYGAFREGMGQMEAPGTLNSPYPWEVISVIRLDWVYLFCGFGANLFVARLLNGALTAGIGLWLLYQGWKEQARNMDVLTTTVFLLPWTCLTLACVYHHHYDITPLMIPLLLLLCVGKRLHPPQWALWTLLPTTLYMLFYPIAPANALLTRLGGEDLAIMGKLIGSGVTTLAMIASLGILYEYRAAAKQTPEAP